MSTVSRETAEELRKRGLTHTLAVGDWCWAEGDHGPDLVVHSDAVGVVLADDPDGFWTSAQGCLWLPTADQVMEVLSSEGWNVVMDCWPGISYVTIHRGLTAREMTTHTACHAQPVEALAAIWLAAHREGAPGNG